MQATVEEAIGRERKKVSVKASNSSGKASSGAHDRKRVHAVELAVTKKEKDMNEKVQQAYQDGIKFNQDQMTVMQSFMLRMNGDNARPFNLGAMALPSPAHTPSTNSLNASFGDASF
eukprot:2978525-Pleurochrysis_carterae.AAC.3